MDSKALTELLEKVASKKTSVAEAADTLRRLPFETLGDLAQVDHHRELRSGVPEIVYGESKSADEITSLLGALSANGNGGLATRVDADKAQVICEQVSGAVFHARARCVVVPPAEPRSVGRGIVGVVCAGTSDLPVADEAAVTLEFLGHKILRKSDIGIAGLQRLIAASEELRKCTVIVAVAGFEGALPSAISGQVPAPIIAVPTSVGYGVGLGGLAALTTMLAGCSPGVTVVNIDNGLGAAIAAARVNR